MAHFSYNEHIDRYIPSEVFEVASRVSTLPSGHPRGFTLEVLDDVESFDLGVRVRAGLAASWFPYSIPGEITVFKPPELVKIEAKTFLGAASLLLTTATDQDRGGTNIGCSLDTDPSRLGKAIEPILNPLIEAVMHDYAGLYRESVVRALEQ